MKERYLELVNTFVNTTETNPLLNNGTKNKSAFEIVGGAEAILTPDPLLAKRTRGFRGAQIGVGLRVNYGALRCLV